MERARRIISQLEASAAAEPAPATMRYLGSELEHSLWSNGKVGTRRGLDGSDDGDFGLTFADYQKQMHNARSVSASLEHEGFTLVDDPVQRIDFYNDDDVLQKYYPHCAQLVKKILGARHVFPFDHNVRNAVGKAQAKKLKGGNAIQSPISTVHTDYTLTSAPARLKLLSHPPKKNDTMHRVLGDRPLIAPDLAEEALESGRFMIINVWRNIATSGPVQCMPLAVCSAASFSPEDLVVFEVHYADRVGENYFVKENSAHKWFYYPEMKSDEALVMMQWDSHGKFAGLGGPSEAKSEHATFSFHAAFDDPMSKPDAPPRESIECRCMVIF